MKGQWLWFEKTIVGVSQAIVTAFLILGSAWQQPSVEATRKFTENHWLSSLKQSDQFDHDFTARLVLHCYKKLHRRFVNEIPWTCWCPDSLCVFLCIFLLPAESPGVWCAPRRILIPARTSWRCIPASTYIPAHETKHWQMLDTRNKEAKSHTHSQLSTSLPHSQSH